MLPTQMPIVATSILPLLLEVLKYAAIGVSTVTGIYGTLTDGAKGSKEQKQRVRKGTIALIAGSALVAVVSQATESHLKSVEEDHRRAAAREQVDKLRTLVSDSIILKEKLSSVESGVNDSAVSLERSALAQKGIGRDAKVALRSLQSLEQKAENARSELEGQTERLMGLGDGQSRLADYEHAASKLSVRFDTPIDRADFFINFSMPSDAPVFSKYIHRLQATSP